MSSLIRLLTACWLLEIDQTAEKKIAFSVYSKPMQHPVGIKKQLLT